MNDDETLTVGDLYPIKGVAAQFADMKAFQAEARQLRRQGKTAAAEVQEAAAQSLWHDMNRKETR